MFLMEEDPEDRSTQDSKTSLEEDFEWGSHFFDRQHRGAHNADAKATQLAIDTVNKSKNMTNAEKTELLADFQKKRAKLEKKMSSAPFTRSQDKVFFLYGVFQIIVLAWLLGRYPNDIYYYFHSIMLVVKLVLKWAYYCKQGWCFFMTDFCYAAAAIHLVALNFYPKNDYMFFISFLFSNGAVAVAVGTFRNSMVFHNLDMMSSLALHFYPQLCTWNLRWFTLPYEKTLA
jgi:hypothetical protein